MNATDGSPAPSGAPRVLVVGGGLAGITAALDCAEAGASVTLVEVRRRLGGAAYSFEREGLQVDNGQHVFLRCCTAYRSLLGRLGSEHLTTVQPRLEIPVLKPGHPPARLRRSSLPAPLHLAGTLARYPYLTPAERAGAVRAALALMRLHPDDRRLDRLTFGEWLAAHGQGPAAVAALWDMFALPSLNLPAAQASLALCAFVFRTGLLSANDAGDIGFHRAPLSQVIGEPARRALEKAGVQVRVGWRAEGLVKTTEGLDVHASGECLSADAVVLAIPHTRAATLLEPLLGESARTFAGLGTAPIVNVHVVYDRMVCELPFVGGVDTPAQYVFDRTETGITAHPMPSDLSAGCQYLAVSLSCAEREMGMGVAALRELYLAALAEMFPAARAARVERFLVTREHAATFRAAPGTAALRPGASTPVPGLVLAGAWTDTGWPATLEGAVRSGHAAADAALASSSMRPLAGALAHPAEGRGR